MLLYVLVPVLTLMIVPVVAAWFLAAHPDLDEPRNGEEEEDRGERDQERDTRLAA